MPTHDTDVVVVGARAAGAATAMLLARAGLDVVVVDRARPGSDTLSTHALMRGAVIQLDRWGLLDRIRAAGTPAIRRTTFHLAGGATVVDIRPGDGIDALYAPRRTVLDPLLADAAAAAGATVRFGFTVGQLLRNSDGRISGVLGTDRLGRSTRIRARFVVGADGANSLVATQVEAPIDEVGHGATSYLYRYWSGVETDGYDWMFRSGVAAGVIPTNDGLACVFVGADVERITARAPDPYASLLVQASPDVADRVLAARPHGRQRRFLGRPGLVRRPWGPGWVLVGDAGYWKDPISAHGITDALRDAELAAHAIVGAIGTTETSASRWMGAYHDVRNRLSKDLFDVTDRVAAGDWTDDDIPLLLLAMSTAMADEVTHLAELAPWPTAAVTAGVGLR
ncbi:MAG: FAD-dependent monooxygenase [Ilumatobacteraceae bacterium]